jgi:hypothetical protein
VDSPSENNDGNKSALAVRKAKRVTIIGMVNQTNAYSHSGHTGLWLESSQRVLGSGIETERSRTHGVFIESNGNDADNITLNSVRSNSNGGDGLFTKVNLNTDTWRELIITGLSTQGNTGWGVNLGQRPNGTAPWPGTIRSRISGISRNNTAGDYQQAFAPGASFKNEVSTT